ncbi:Rv1733c family protein [Nocardia colli]
MRRREDRVQSITACVLILLFTIIVPVLAIVFGGHVYRTETDAAQAESAHMRMVKVTAVETATTPLNAFTTQTKVSWRENDGTDRTAEYFSKDYVKPGTSWNIWLDETGHIVAPPEYSSAAGKAVLWTVGAIAGVLVVFLSGFLVLRGRLDRRRLQRWEAEWVGVDRLWGNRS